MRTLELSKFTKQEQDFLQQLLKTLAEAENSELETGKLLTEGRAICEKYGEFINFLYNLPFTPRTGYRRIKTYDRACEIWPQEIVDLAIKRRMRIVGYTDEKPMGLLEDLKLTVPKILTRKLIDRYLSEVEVRIRREGQVYEEKSSHEALKDCFQTLERNVRGLTLQERQKFLKDLVGLQMAFLGAWKPQTFSPTQIPQDMWLNRRGGQPKSPETRKRIRESALKRWERVREAKGEK
jgi:hypothetical protein